MSEPTPETVLATPMVALYNDADAATIRDYLVKLLLGVWQDRGGFIGKKPFGNSGWEYDIYVALAKAGHIAAEFYDDGYCDLDSLTDEEERKADKLIDDAINSLGGAR